MHAESTKRQPVADVWSISVTDDDNIDSCRHRNILTTSDHDLTCRPVNTIISVVINLDENKNSTTLYNY